MFHVEEITGNRRNQYNQVIRQLQALIEGEKDWLANLANSASLLYHTLEHVNWVGFYLMKQNELVLGPFVGKPACVRIPIGKGVCGTAIASKQAQVVEDVHQFPGHIACDAETRSEIVIPLFVEGKIIGVLDIDSPELSRFTTEDLTYLEQYVKILLSNTDWTQK